MNVERLAFGEDGEAVLVEDLLADQTAELLRLVACLLSGGGYRPYPLQRPHWREQSFTFCLYPGSFGRKAGVSETRSRRFADPGRPSDIEGDGEENGFLCWGTKSIIPAMVLKECRSQAGYPPYPIEDIYADCWMYQSLTSEAGSIPKGKVRCADALDKPEYWRE